jgi:hypothetical protein
MKYGVFGLAPAKRLKEFCGVLKDVKLQNLFIKAEPNMEVIAMKLMFLRKAVEFSRSLVTKAYYKLGLLAKSYIFSLVFY